MLITLKRYSVKIQCSETLLIQLAENSGTLFIGKLESNFVACACFLAGLRSVPTTACVLLRWRLKMKARTPVYLRTAWAKPKHPEHFRSTVSYNNCADAQMLLSSVTLSQTHTHAHTHPHSSTSDGFDNNSIIFFSLTLASFSHTLNWVWIVLAIAHTYTHTHVLALHFADYRSEVLWQQPFI